MTFRVIKRDMEMRQRFGLLCFALLMFPLNSLFAGAGIAVGNCIVGQLAPEGLRAKSQIIGAKYFYISPDDRIPSCKKSLQEACLGLVTSWVESGIISSKVLSNGSTHYWYLDPQRFDCRDIEENIPHPEGEVLPQRDLDKYYPDWKNVLRFAPVTEPTWENPNVIHDLKDLVQHIYQNASWTTILAVSAILLMLLGVKGIHQGFLAGPVAAEPATVLAAMAAIVLIAMNAGLLEGAMQERFEKYSVGMSMEINPKGEYVFTNHPEIDSLVVNDQDNSWKVNTSSSCREGKTDANTALATSLDDC